MTSAGWLEQLNPQVHDAWSGKWPPRFVEPGRRLIDHELVLFSEGVCDVEIGDARHVCPAGTFLIIPPGISHVTHARATAVRRHCVHFDWHNSLPRPAGLIWSFSQESFDRRRVRPAPNWVPAGTLSGTFESGSRVETLSAELMARWRSGGSPDRDCCRPLLLEILLLLFTPHVTHPLPDRAAELAATVRSLLGRLPPGKSDRSIVTEMEKLGYSYEYLCRCFTKRYGIAPNRYMTQSRIESAKAMLRDRGMKVGAVAKELGYEDAGYFIRTFRRYTGTTPRAYALKSAVTS